MHILYSCPIAIALMFGAVAFGIQPQNDWELEKKERGIEVFTRMTPGSDFKEFQGVMYVTGARLSSLVAAFDDTSSYPNWMHNCIEAKLLKKINTFQRYTYFAIKAAWPASDRDNVVYSELNQDAKTLAVTISMTGIPGYLPPHGSRARIPVMKTSWLFQPMESGAVKIVYRSKSDPGGSIPAGIANLAAVDLPFYTLLNLSKIIKEERYARARYQEIKEPRAE
jgi:hypothetical protein